MLFLPFDKFEIETTRTKSMVQHDLECNTNIGTVFSLFSGGPCFFNGRVEGSSFTIGKNIFGRNSFLPIIHGKILETENGCIVKINMRMSVFTMLFMAFWLTMSAPFAFSYVYSLFTDVAAVGSQPFPTMFAFGYILMMAAYKIPAIECRRKLNEIIGDDRNIGDTDMM